MSPEIIQSREQKSQIEGIKAAAKKADQVSVIARRGNYPKEIYPTNRRISFTNGWRN